MCNLPIFIFFYYPFQIFTFRRQTKSHNLLNTTMSPKRAQICFTEIVLLSALGGFDHPKELVLRLQLLTTSPCALWEAPPESEWHECTEVFAFNVERPTEMLALLCPACFWLLSSEKVWSPSCCSIQAVFFWPELWGSSCQIRVSIKEWTKALHMKGPGISCSLCCCSVLVLKVDLSRPSSCEHKETHSFDGVHTHAGAVCRG